ncbi:MAG: gfo/Idh/MocA family oxidoreductase [Bacteroidetes bacterium]|nr:MAG: gfo/Idh/MocA family oxidoreductase [Bacteroidota bacterium]MBL1144650.1 gfo/Idh/MocA family oxidoreductase [Bacteroidota bacterium]NOG57445.1 Gfo/Idh/MocA family oxidoreductase [Bacteroidota bacterium]
MSGKIKFAIVGAGRIGQRHAKMVEVNSDAELVALIDSDTSKKEELESTFKVSFFASTEDFYRSGIEVDVVNVCTPNYLHAVQSMEALRHKCHVVVEKPMALSKKDAEQVIHLSLQMNKRVFCVMQNRYSPPSQWLKEILDKKLLGEIYLANVNCFWNRDADYYKGGDATYWKGKLDQDGGTLFTQFSHFLDMMYWLLGDITNISARFFDFNHQHTTEFEDSGIVQFDFVNGGAGSINYSTSVYNTNMESSISIIGEKGSVKVGGQYMNEIVYCNIENYEQPVLQDTLPPNDYGKYKGSAANHQFVIQNVVDTLLKGETVTTNSLEGLKVVEIIENIYKLK